MYILFSIHFFTRNRPLHSCKDTLHFSFEHATRDIIICRTFRFSPRPWHCLYLIPRTYSRIRRLFLFLRSPQPLWRIYFRAADCQGGWECDLARRKRFPDTPETAILFACLAFNFARRYIDVTIPHENMCTLVGALSDFGRNVTTDKWSIWSELHLCKICKCYKRTWCRKFENIWKIQSCGGT